MSLRDQDVALSAGDLSALELLRADRDGCGEGVDRSVLGAAGCTLYSGSLLARLRAHGYVIGEIFDGADRRYQLGHSEPAVERSSGPAAPPADAPLQECAGASLGGELRLFDPRPGRMPASGRGTDAQELSTAA